jgi:hypothetical protein
VEESELANPKRSHAVVSSSVIVIRVQGGLASAHPLLLHYALEVLPVRLDRLLQLTLRHELLVELRLHLNLLHQRLAHVVVVGTRTTSAAAATAHPAEPTRGRTRC